MLKSPALPFFFFQLVPRLLLLFSLGRRFQKQAHKQRLLKAFTTFFTFCLRLIFKEVSTYLQPHKHCLPCFLARFPLLCKTVELRLLASLWAIARSRKRSIWSLLSS